MPAFGNYKFEAVRTVGLIAFWLVFFGAYVGVGAAMSAVTAGRLPPLAMARRFAFTLVPIAIGYHLAHYLTFLLIQGQYIIPLVSDPFGFGWNLFGTAGYRVDIAVVDARFAWYAAVTAILVGHIAAVYLAHLEALQVFDAPAAALRSQVPLTALMVVYTFVSLSILAEPLVERRTPAPPSRDRARRSGRRGAAGAGKRSAAAGGRRQAGQAEAQLPRDGLGLPRRYADEHGRSALRLHVRVPLGRRRCSCRSADRRRHRGHARTASGRAGRWVPTAPRSPIGSGTSRSPASCSWSRSTRRRRPWTPSRTRWSRRPGARCPGISWC